MKSLHMLAFLLIVVGGLNWGLVGAFDFNLVNKLLGSWPMVERVVYILVGLAAILEAVTHSKNCRTCSTKDASMPAM